MRSSSVKAIFAATFIGGTLDILSAFVFGGMAGIGPAQILRFIASGPFGDSVRQGGTSEALLGLFVHFALMAIIVTIFVLTATLLDAFRHHWPAAGAAYGVAIYLVMYWIVTPARFGTYPEIDLWSVGTALFSHIVCVGLPIAWVTSRQLSTPPGAQVAHPSPGLRRRRGFVSDG